MITKLYLVCATIILVFVRHCSLASGYSPPAPHISERLNLHWNKSHMTKVGAALSDHLAQEASAIVINTHL